MIKNYLKVALRALLRNKLSSFINVFGLALAMACCVLIYIFIQDELSYDKHHANADRIYRVTRNFLSSDGSVNLHLGHVAPPFGPLLKNDFTEFESVVRTLRAPLFIALEESGQEKKAFTEDKAYFAEPEVFDVFSISVTQGNATKALTEPFQIMLSESMAKKYFGENQPLGKTLRVGNQFDVVVSGVYQDFPKQTHITPEMIVSFSTLNDTTIYGKERLATNWGNNMFGTYVLAKEPLNIKHIEAQFPAFLDRHMGNKSDPNATKPSSWTTLFIQKVTDIHLHSHLDSEDEVNGNINNVYMMGVIGLFILLIACFNFVNLSTARASKRAKEVGLRKVVGAFKQQLVYQYLSESLLISFLAFVIALAIVFPAIAWLNVFTGKSISLDLFGRTEMLGGLIGFAAFVGLLAGVYPAFILSAFKPALTLKGQQGNTAGGKGYLRKSLVVVQFSISIVLIIATIVTVSQLKYMNTVDLGYAKDQIITLPYYTDLDKTYESFYNEITAHASVKEMARSSRVPTGRLLDYQGDTRVPKGDSLVSTNIVLKNIGVDPEFFNTYEITFVTGGSFPKDMKKEDPIRFIINEAAVKMMGLMPHDLQGKEIEYAGQRGQLVGIVKDFHFESLHQNIVPMIFHPATGFNSISVKLSGANTQQGIADVEKVWKQFMPQNPFAYQFLSERYSNLYNEEQKQSQLFIVFAGLAILIACLGLFGLATFNAMQRVKEIGIRKVLGASVPSILGLLSKEIVILIVISNLIAWPVAWYFMGEWLTTFAYHIPMSIVPYLFAGVAAVLIALITISAQTLKAASGNPASTLKYE